MFATARMSETQLQALTRAIEGREVYDFGCGTGVFTRALTMLGTTRVVGIDKEGELMELAIKHLSSQNASFVHADFEEYLWDAPASFDVGLVSWPSNRRNPHLVQLIQRCKTVIYIGKNTDWTACGGPDLFDHLAQRAVVEYVPEFTNVLCVYGAMLDESRALIGEEIAALHQWVGEPKNYTTAQAEQLASERAALGRVYRSGMFAMI